jgi:hypothetical protein
LARGPLDKRPLGLALPQRSGKDKGRWNSYQQRVAKLEITGLYTSGDFTDKRRNY